MTKHINSRKIIFSIVGLFFSVLLIWAAFERKCPEQKIITEVQGITSETKLSSMLSRSTCLFADRSALIMSTAGVALLLYSVPLLFRGLSGE